MWSTTAEVPQPGDRNEKLPLGSFSRGWRGGECCIQPEQMVTNGPGSNSCVRHGVIVKHMFGSANSPCVQQLKDNVNPSQLHFPTLAIKPCC